MDRREYCRQLTQELRHLTASEVAAVRQEFMDHMEDHAEMLREAGYDEAEADARAVEAMGDPVETGREIDKQYPAIWLWLSRIAVAVIVIVCIRTAFGYFGGMHSFFEILSIRYDPYRDMEITMEEQIDYKMEVGNDIIHFIAITDYTPDEDCTAILYYNIYDKRLFSPIDYNLDNYLTFSTDDSTYERLAGGSWANKFVKQIESKINLSADDTSILIAYDRFSDHAECRIDLTEVGK